MALAILHTDKADSTDCNRFIIVLLVILYMTHYVISIVIAYNVYIFGFLNLFGLITGFLLLPSIIGMIILDYIVINERDGGKVNVSFPFAAILFFLTAGKYNLIDSNPDCCGCRNLNRSFPVCRYFNIVIVLILMPLVTPLSPIYSIIGLFRDKEGRKIWINYHLLSIITGTIMPIIIICISSSSLIITILCMVIVIIGISYLIMALFFGFEISFGDKGYWGCVPFMITIECVLIINMLFIVSFIGLWKSDFQQLSDVLFIVCFIIVLTLNCPGYKSYFMYQFFMMLDKQPAFKYVLQEQCSLQRLNKMYCVLLSKAKNAAGENSGITDERYKETDTLLNRQDTTTKSMAVSGQPRIMQQYTFSKLNLKDKRRFIDSYVDIGNKTH